MKRLRDTFTLAGLLGSQAAAVVALHRLGSQAWLRAPSAGDLPHWLTTAAPDDVLATALRLIALGCAYWLLASTGVYVLARLSRLPAAVAAVGWATLPAARRVADRAVAVSLATATMVGSGAGLAAAGGVHGLPVHVDGRVVVPPGAPRLEPVGDLPVPPALTGPGHVPTPLVGAPDRPPVPRPAQVAEPPPTTGQEEDGAVVHVVQAGDSLWRLSASRLTQLSGEQAAPPETAVRAYWLTVIDANRDTLRSGDPDLIFPGEQLTLPPVPPALSAP